MLKPEDEIISFMKESTFANQAVELHATCLDDSVFAPVGVFYKDSRGGWKSVHEMHENINHVLDKCEQCLTTATDCNYICETCTSERRVCETCKNLGYREWHDMVRPCSRCLEEKKDCIRLCQLGWASDCESKQKAYMERMNELLPKHHQHAFPDAPHNIKSVRSGLFWYWVLLDNFLVCLRLLLVLRKDANLEMRSKMKTAVSLKALKNKDRMCVETAVEVLSPPVQEAIPEERVVITIVPEIYTFWKQNLPGVVKCPVGVAVDEKSGIVFFSDISNPTVCKSDLHCPANVSSIAGNGKPGRNNGRSSSFTQPAGLCIFDNLIFLCDAGNSCIRIVDVSSITKRGYRRGKVDGNVHVEESTDQTGTDDEIPVPGKSTVTYSLTLLNASESKLKRPVDICCGRVVPKCLPELFVADSEQGMIFVIQSLKRNSSMFQGILEPLDLHDLYTQFVRIAVEYKASCLFVGNACAENPSILQIDVKSSCKGTIIRIFSHPLLGSPSGLCITGDNLFVTDSKYHCIHEVKVPEKNDAPAEAISLFAGKNQVSGAADGIVSSSRFHSPHGISSFGLSLVVCDSGNNSVRMITSAAPLKRIGETFYPYCKLFNLDHYRGKARFSFIEGLNIIGTIVRFLLEWESCNFERTNRRATQGPDQIIPYSTRRSFVLIHESLISLHNLFVELGIKESFEKHFNYTSIVTLGIENFFSLMRAEDSMPTQVSYANRRAKCTREMEKKTLRWTLSLLYGS